MPDEEMAGEPAPMKPTKHSPPQPTLQSTQQPPQDFAEHSGVALVSGGSGGIGASVCKALAARGAEVIFTVRSNLDAAAELEGEIAAAGGRASGVQLDLSDTASTAAAVQEAAAPGGLHTLVYASGPYVPMVYVGLVEPERFWEQCSNDILAFYNLLHPALEHLRRSQGSVVAVTTCANRRFPNRDFLSSAPNGAVEAVVRAVAREEGRYGVRANCVGPGMMADGMAALLMESGEIDEKAQAVALREIALGRLGHSSDIAEAVCFLASERARYITGQFLDVDGGYSI